MTAQKRLDSEENDMFHYAEPIPTFPSNTLLKYNHSVGQNITGNTAVEMEITKLN